MKAITLIILGLIFVLSLLGLIMGTIDLGLHAVAVPLMGTIASGYLLAKVVYADHQLETLRAFLLSNREALESGQLRYKGLPVTPETEVFRCAVAISVVFASLKAPSQFYFASKSNRRFLCLWHTLLSVVFGWWGLPWGPVYTVQAVAFNSKGGDRMTLHDVMFSQGL